MPDTFFGLPIMRVPYEDAEKTIARLRSEGHAAIMIGTDKDESYIQENSDYPTENYGINPRTGERVDLGPIATPAEILKDADDIDPERWFQDRLQRLGINLDDFVGEPPPEHEWTKEIELRPSTVKNPFYTHAYLVRLPTDVTSEAPARLLFGATNLAPDSAEQVAIARYWEQRWGARIDTILPWRNVINYDVAYPPTRREDVIALAREHYLFCDATGDIPEYAASLMEQRRWLFTWT